MASALQFIGGLLVMLFMGTIGAYVIINQTGLEKKVRKIIKDYKNRRRVKRIKKTIKHIMKEFKRKMSH